MNTQANKTVEAPRKHAFRIEPDGQVWPMVMVRGNAVEELPAAVFRLNHDPERGMFLMPENDFQLPDRIYGSVNGNVDKFLRSFELNDKNLGILLIGEKGSGKTLTMKELAKKAMEIYGMPVILITTPYTGDTLINFMSSITQPTLVLFDELDKTYGSSDKEESSKTARQNTLLQLLDGTSTGNKKLFACSANAMEGISEYLIDRPSRIRYTIKFERLSLQSVVDFVSSNLTNHSEEDLRAFVHVALADGAEGGGSHRKSRASNGLNFDSMKELVKEINQMKDSLNEAMDIMMSNGRESFTRFMVDVYQDGKLIEKTHARGIHHGAYIGKDASKITVHRNILKEGKKFKGEGEEPTTYEYLALETVNLTEKDFIGFASEADMVEFQKDGFQFILRYTRYIDYNEAKDLTEAALSAKNASVRGSL